MFGRMSGGAAACAEAAGTRGAAAHTSRTDAAASTPLLEMDNGLPRVIGNLHNCDRVRLQINVRSGRNSILRSTGSNLVGLLQRRGAAQAGGDRVNGPSWRWIRKPEKRRHLARKPINVAINSREASVIIFMMVGTTCS